MDFGKVCASVGPTSSGATRPFTFMNPFRFPALLAVACAVCACPAAEPSPVEQLRAELREIAGSSSLKVGIAIKDLVTGDEFTVNADETFPQGSCIRIHLISELFRQHAAKKLSLDDVRILPETSRTGGFGVLRFMDRRVALTLRDYAVLVSTVNDNSAANFLTDIVGMDNVNASLAAQGTPEIKFVRKAMSRRDAPSDLPENVATPRSAMRALDLIHRGRVVDRATSDAILDLLALPEASYFHRELPSGIRFAGRSGSGPSFRCDEGVVLLSDRPYVFCVMVDGIGHSPAAGRRDYSRADVVISAVSRRAFTYFSRLTLPGSGRVTQN